MAGTQSFTTGAAALLTLLAAHRVLSWARFQPRTGRLVEHRVRVLVEDGRLRRGQLRRCGLTEADLAAQLRQRGVRDLAELRYVLYEATGELTIVSSDPPDAGDLVTAAVRTAADPPARHGDAPSGGQ